MKLSLLEDFVSNIIVTMVISNKSCCKHVLFTNLSDFISTTTRVTSLKSKKFLFCSFSVAKFGIAPFKVIDHYNHSNIIWDQLNNKGTCDWWKVQNSRHGNEPLSAGDAWLGLDRCWGQAKNELQWPKTHYLAKLHYTSCLDGVWIKIKKSLDQSKQFSWKFGSIQIKAVPNPDHPPLGIFWTYHFFCTKHKIIENEKGKLLETLQYTIKEFNNYNVVCSTMHCPYVSRGRGKGCTDFVYSIVKSCFGSYL